MALDPAVRRPVIMKATHNRMGKDLSAQFSLLKLSQNVSIRASPREKAIFQWHRKIVASMSRRSAGSRV
jgi:hypothetical protein